MKSHRNGGASTFFTLILAGLTVHGCVPHIRTTEEQKYFHIPSSKLPWQQLTNGVDLYAWHQCYIRPDRKHPVCSSLNLNLLDRSSKPDFKTTTMRPLLGWTAFDEVTVAPLISAHSDTQRRIVGLANSGGKYAVYALRGGLADLHALDATDDRSKVEVIDIWHNAKPYCEEAPKPKLVVTDDRFLWIFAEPGSQCAAAAKDLYAPGDLLRFDAPGGFSDLLRTPMQLFYLDRENRNAAEFSAPRTVSTDLKLLNSFPKNAVGFDSIHIPTSQVFKLETNMFNHAIPQTPLPNWQCDYSETRFFLTIYEDTPNPELTRCKPFAVKAADLDG